VLRPFDLLENVLIDVEKGNRTGISADDLAEKYDISERHLRRLFRFAFKQPLCGYIRSRKLAVSLEDLLKSDKNILDIAVDYGFGYEQSYIRAFKREFGITPGDLRKNGQIVKIKPPIQLFDEKRLPEGVLFGPDFVMVPKFHIIGKPGIIPFAESVSLAPKMAKDFWHNERSLIKNITDPNVYIGLTSNIDREAESSEYMPSIMVENLNGVPPGLSGKTFDSSLCARFRYIGQHHYYEINRHVAGAMYDAVWKFAQGEYEPEVRAKYALLNDRVYFEKIDISLYDGTYCQMEWFSPVVEKAGFLATVF